MFISHNSVILRLLACGLFCALATVTRADDGASTTAPTHVSDAALRDRCVKTLRTLLTAEHGPNVHAAEVLIWDGYPQGIRKIFLAQTGTTADSYRVLVWRVLAQCSDPKERDAYIEDIRKVAIVTDKPASENAIESLGKLGYSGRDPAIVEVAKKGEPVMRILAAWVLANGGQADDEKALADLLDDKDSHTRGIAAYALRFLKTLRPPTIARLQYWLDKEPADAAGRVFLVDALYLKGPEKDREHLKTELLKYTLTGNAEDRYQAGLVVGAWADESDLPALEPLLTSEDKDVRVAAAHAILTALHRMSPAKTHPSP